VYSVLKRLGSGEFQHVASCDDLKRAEQLIDSLKGFWPGEYSVRDPEGNEVDSGLSSERRSALTDLKGNSGSPAD
jgi:hypothetical protein